MQEMQEMWVRSLGWKDPLEKEMATHSSVLALRIPGTGRPGWAAVYGVAQSQTQLKRLSSSSSSKECEVKWALGSITMDKACGGDGIPVELFQILKDDAMKVLHSIHQQIWKTQPWYILIPPALSSVQFSHLIVSSSL